MNDAAIDDPSSHSDRIRLRDLVRSGLRIAPDLVGVTRGLLRLATMRPEAHGSICSLIETHARNRPNAMALGFEGRRWSYAEFNCQANRIAAVLRSQGLHPGEAVGILMENRAEVLFCVAAVLKMGGIAGMLNYQQRGEALAHSLELTRARLVIVGEECREALESTRVAGAPEGDRRYLWEGESEPPPGFVALRPLLAGADPHNPPESASIRLKAPAFYIFTSGTTGLPKASVMSHFRWLYSMAGLGESAVRLKPEDVLYCCLPFYHNNALTVSWGAVLARGSTLVISRKFSASRFWDEIRSSGATSFCYIGELLRYLLNRPATPQDRDHKVRVIVGNGLRSEIWDAFQQRFGIERICEFYGASESNLAFVNAWNMPRTAGFCPLSYAIVQFDADTDAPVRDRSGHLRRVGSGGIGLLLSEVTRHAPFDGYTDSKASEAKLLRNVFKEGDCWFNTGDLVRDQGWHHIQFVDRVGDTFRWKGENVATTEVESALGACQGVEEAVVYGVQVPGADGRVGMASLCVSDKSFDGAALARQIKQRLPAYAVPVFLRLRGDQDTTSTFKHRKVELKREAFDPSLVKDPLYVLNNDAYVPMTPDDHARIQRADWRF